VRAVDDSLRGRDDAEQTADFPAAGALRHSGTPDPARQAVQKVRRARDARRRPGGGREGALGASKMDSIAVDSARRARLELAPRVIQGRQQGGREGEESVAEFCPWRRRHVRRAEIESRLDLLRFLDR